MELADGKGVLVESFDDSHLRSSLLAAFPELAADIDPEESCYGVMATLDRAITELLHSRHDARAQAIVSFVDSLLDRRNLHPDIRNAIQVSFIEYETLSGTTAGRMLWEHVPERLRQLLVET